MSIIVSVIKVFLPALLYVILVILPKPFPSLSPFAIITIIFHGFKPLIFLSFAFLRNYQTSAVGLVLDPVGISNRILIFSGHWAPFVVYSSEMVLFLS